MKLLMIDDERMAIEHLKTILEKSQQVELDDVVTFVSPSDALQWAQTEQADVAFVDIEMPEMNGLVLAEKLKSLQPQIEIIFVTAFQEYAVEAFEQYALDYLLKPVRRERMQTTINRIHTRLKEKKSLAKSLEMVTIHLLGNLTIQKGDQAIDLKWRSGRVKELFALLLHFRQQPISKFDIIDYIWPDFSDKKASTHLHMTIYRLRQLIQTHEIDVVIKFQDESYQLILGTEIVVDVDQWHHHLQQHPTVTSVNIRACIDALHVKQGRYMQNLDYNWANNEQAYLEKSYTNRLMDIARFLSETKQYDEAIKYYEQAFQLNSYDQQIMIELFQLYAIKHRNSDIERFYKEVQHIYQEELVTPMSKMIERWYRNWQKKLE
ncbi:response regulator [Aquibacillus koreensis]|uniref:Response regulator n=1 Tax=Aquibacillus koreensis TaxID=279446 RepID=A0A9X3WJR1_9BACI|nr:response regulator [Aquibacillus koreensis]MCT2537137.1 response regulator [Aquibacillus koreensis]MDC3419880.1 response regulator [Aquibacillus koreensis]